MKKLMFLLIIFNLILLPNVFAGQGHMILLAVQETPDGHLGSLADLSLETKPGSGGKLCRSAGTVARILTKTKTHVLVQLPSKQKRKFDLKCRATIGEIAGTGRLEKPIVKAGKRHHMMKAKNKLYPQTSGVAMNAVDHPFGSGRGRHIGKSKIAPRNAPPGRNVGLIRARRTGKRK